MDISILDGIQRAVAMDFESTGKRVPTVEQMAKAPKGFKPPGAIIEIGCVELLRTSEQGWRKGETWETFVNPDGPIEPKSIPIHGITLAKVKNAPRFKDVVERLRAFVGDSPIVAHAYKNERDYLDYEFARIGLIPWGGSAYAQNRYVCTQQIYSGLFPGAPKNLDALCDRLWIDRSDRFAKHGALLDADLTADAIIRFDEIDQGLIDIDRPRTFTVA